MNNQLIALTPQDLAPAQQHLMVWCHQKIQALGKELREHRQNLRIAKTHKWKHSGWVNVERRTKARMIYYTKIRDAVRAGFLLIPNLPVEVIAVRVSNDAPRSDTATYPNEINKAQAEPLLAIGKGRYVDETLPHQDLTHYERNEQGEPALVPAVSVGHAFTEEIDFPFIAVKPQILEATARVMALKLFDQIGIAHGLTTSSLTHRRSDPMVIGQMLGEKVGYGPRKVASFFVAWWLDFEDL